MIVSSPVARLLTQNHLLHPLMPVSKIQSEDLHVLLSAEQGHGSEPAFREQRMHFPRLQRGNDTGPGQQTVAYNHAMLTLISVPTATLRQKQMYRGVIIIWPRAGRNDVII